MNQFQSKGVNEIQSQGANEIQTSQGADKFQSQGADKFQSQGANNFQSHGGYSQIHSQGGMNQFQNQSRRASSFQSHEGYSQISSPRGNNFQSRGGYPQNSSQGGSYYPDGPVLQTKADTQSKEIEQIIVNTIIPIPHRASVDQSSSDYLKDEKTEGGIENEKEEIYDIKKKVKSMPLRPVPIKTFPQRKFCSPPTFYGKQNEDVVDWIQRYEDSATYDNWTDAELVQHFGRYIEGVCRKWFRCLSPPPKVWRNQIEVPANQGVGKAFVPAITGLRTLFEAAFQQGNNVLFQEQEIRNKIQRKDKDHDLISLAKPYHGLENRSGSDRLKEKEVVTIKEIEIIKEDEIKEGVDPIPLRPVPIKIEKKILGGRKHR